MFRLGPTPVSDLKYSAGVAYIALPTDLERNVYINDCYQNFRVSVWGEDGSFMNRVPIPPEILNFIEFPADEKQKGSPVIYVTDELQSQPVIIARFPYTNQLGDGKENEFSIKRNFNNSFVDIRGNAEKNFCSIAVDGGNNSGNLYIKVSGADGTVFNIEVTGDISITSQGKIEIVQQEGFTVTTLNKDSEDENDSNNEVFSQTIDGVKIQSKKIVVNNGNEPYVLGHKLKSFLDDLIDTISKATVSTAIGQQPLINAAQIAAFKAQTQDLLSEIMFIDK